MCVLCHNILRGISTNYRLFSKNKDCFSKGISQCNTILFSINYHVFFGLIQCIFKKSPIVIFENMLYRVTATRKPCFQKCKNSENALIIVPNETWFLQFSCFSHILYFLIISITLLRTGGVHDRIWCF